MGAPVIDRSVATREAAAGCLSRPEHAENIRLLQRNTSPFDHAPETEN